MKRVLPCLIILLLPLQAMGNGYTLPDTGGNFSSPVDPNPAGIYWNPAVISLSRGLNFLADIAPFYFRARYRKEDGNFDIVRYEALDFIPFAGLTCTKMLGEILNSLSAGVAFFTPFAAEAHYPEDGPQRFQGVDGSNYLMSLSPALSLRLFEVLSLGFAFNIGFGRFEAKGSTMLLPDRGEVPENEGKYEFGDMEGVALGYTAGVFISPFEFLDAGISFTSGMDVTHRGKYRFYATEKTREFFQTIFQSEDIRGDGEVIINYPAFISMGTKVKPLKKLEFNLLFQWFNWSTYRKMKIRLKNGRDALTGREVDVGLIGEEQELPTNFEDAIYIRVDGRYKPAKNLSLLLAAGYDQSGIPDEYLSVMNLEFDKIVIAGGLNLEITKYLIISGGVNFYIPFARNVRNSLLAPPANGRYSAEGMKGNISVWLKL